MRRSKVLEFCAVCTGLLGKRHQEFCSRKIAVVVCGYVSDEVAGLGRADGSVPYLKITHCFIVGGYVEGVRRPLA